jgi:hypothetical protein
MTRLTLVKLNLYDRSNGQHQGCHGKSIGTESMKVIEDSAFFAGANSQEAMPFLKGR